MVRRFRFVFGPRWLALHVVVVAACVTMVMLGRWQWHVAHVHHGSVQNYAYAFQWWAFTAFALFMWFRLIHDAAPPLSVSPEATGDGMVARPVTGEATPAASEPAEVPYRRYVMPSITTSPPVAVDAEHAAYNAYLARLAGQASAEDDG